MSNNFWKIFFFCVIYSHCQKYGTWIKFVRLSVNNAVIIINCYLAINNSCWSKPSLRLPESVIKWARHIQTNVSLDYAGCCSVHIFRVVIKASTRWLFYFGHYITILQNFCVREQWLKHNDGKWTEPLSDHFIASRCWLRCVKTADEINLNVIIISFLFFYIWRLRVH